MTLSPDQIRVAAERLDQAEKTKLQIRQISLDHPGITIDDAYAIQKAWVEMKIAAGRVVKGHKIALAIRVTGYGLTIDRTPSPQPSPHGRGSAPPLLQRHRKVSI